MIKTAAGLVFRLGVVFFVCAWLSLGPTTKIVLADPLSSTELQALDQWPEWVAQSDCGSGGGAAASGVDAVPSKINISSIVSKYGLQSVMIQDKNGSVITDYNSSKPPVTLASTMKLVIVDTLLRSGADMNTVLTVSSDVLYDHKSDLPSKKMSIDNIINSTLDGSSNVGANLLIKYLGGVSAFTQKAQADGYTNTNIGGYYDPSNDGKNSSTIADQVTAMTHILNTGTGGYSTAKAALEKASKDDNHYGVSSSANKWGGTSQVSSNVGQFAVDNNNYVIGLYINQGSVASGSKIKSASQELAIALGGVSSPLLTNSSASPTECCGGSESIAAGTLPTIIPEPYNGAFTAAATKYNIPPALVAGIFSEEHNIANAAGNINPDTSKAAAGWARLSKSHTNPNSGWDSSSAGASGPFQFIPGTWNSYGVDGNGDGKKDVENLVDASFGAAKYLAANMTPTGADKPSSAIGYIKKAVFDYNHADWYVNAVVDYYNFYNGQPSATPDGSPTTISSSSATSDCSNETGDGSSQSIVAAAQKELELWKSGSMKPGFRKSSSDSFSKYSQNRDEDWCADFSSWVYKTAGIPLQSDRGGSVSYVPDIQSIGEKNEKFHWHAKGSGYTPKPGDLAVHSSSHVNIFISVSGTKTTYIGGNQGGSGGTGSFHDNSSVTTEVLSGYYSSGITGYVSTN